MAELSWELYFHFPLSSPFQHLPSHWASTQRCSVHPPTISPTGAFVMCSSSAWYEQWAHPTVLWEVGWGGGRGLLVPAITSWARRHLWLVEVPGAGGFRVLLILVGAESPCCCTGEAVGSSNPSSVLSPSYNQWNCFVACNSAVD